MVVVVILIGLIGIVLAVGGFAAGVYELATFAEQQATLRVDFLIGTRLDFLIGGAGVALYALACLVEGMGSLIKAADRKRG